MKNRHLFYFVLVASSLSLFALISVAISQNNDRPIYSTEWSGGDVFYDEDSIIGATLYRSGVLTGDRYSGSDVVITTVEPQQMTLLIKTLREIQDETDVATEKGGRFCHSSYDAQDTLRTYYLGGKVVAVSDCDYDFDVGEPVADTVSQLLRDYFDALREE